MSKPKLSPMARKARVITGLAAWWYANEKSIDVLIQTSPGQTIGQTRITRAEIESWLKKLEPK